MLKNHKYRNSILGLIALLLSIGCENVNVNFTMNNQNLPANESVLTEAGDSILMLEYIVGDTILLVDDSRPLDKVKSRIWDVNGDGLIDKEYNNKDFFPIVFSEADKGLQKIRLCVNGSENCVTKWIFVKEDPFPETSVSRLTFLSSTTFSTETKQSTYNLRIQTEDVFAASELTLTINGNESSFDFDEETAIISKELQLKTGRNDIEITAADYGLGTETEAIEIIYKKDNNSPSQMVYGSPLIAPTSAMVKIIKPKSGYKTQIASEEIRVQSKGLSKKGDLRVQLNGQNLRKMRFNKSNEEWVIPVTWGRGENELIVTGRNSKGESTARTSVNYLGTKRKFNGTSSTAGTSFKTINRRCLKYSVKYFNVSISPKKNIELTGFTVISSVCGGLEISLLGGEKVIVALKKGENKVTIPSYGMILNANTRNTLKFRPIAGYNCNSSLVPKLADASQCNPESVSNPHFSINQGGKTVIFDFKYSH